MRSFIAIIGAIGLILSLAMPGTVQAETICLTVDEMEASLEATGGIALSRTYEGNVAKAILAQLGYDRDFTVVRKIVLYRSDDGRKGFVSVWGEDGCMLGGKQVPWGILSSIIDKMRA